MKLAFAVTSVIAILSASCTSVDDDRIPAVPVHIEFSTVGEWQNFGVAGALDYRKFIKSERLPEGFAYSDAEATGFGGVLLVCGFDNTPLAYDLSCPVEIKKDIRVYIDPELNIARCPVCQSTYDVFRTGAPLSGTAAENGYALTRYRVAPGSASLSYMMISH